MSFAPDPLDDLVAKAAAGDRRALESLLLHFHDPLLRFITTSLVQPGGDISPDDLLQETFLAACRAAASIEPRGQIAFFAWLKTIARTRFLNMVEARNAQKRGGRFQHLPSASSPDATALSLVARLAGQDQTPSRIARNHELLTAITAALAALDPDRRRIIDLRYHLALELDDIVELTGKTKGSVKMLIDRTLKDLRAVLYPAFGEFSLGV